MSTDASDTGEAQGIPAFYAGERGAVARRILRSHLAAIWPDTRRLDVMGVGFVAPYLDLWQHEAARTEAVTLDAGAPLPDLGCDRILLVHALERATDAPRLLRECWRALRDDGRLLVVVPNRIGVWAHLEATPFGEGQPYTQGQLAALLRAAAFAVERTEHALYVPPVRIGAVLRTAALAERLGRRFAPGIGGVIVVEAVKDVYAAAPLLPIARRRIIAAPSLGTMRAA